MRYLYETHMHSSEVSACARRPAALQVRYYKQLGYTGIIMTDHFTNGFSNCPSHIPWKEKMDFIKSGYDIAKVEGDKCGLDVFFGWEYTIKGSDFLTYGLDMEFLLAHPDIDYLSIEDYSAIVRENGGFLAQAHPYRDDYFVLHKFPVNHRLIDAVEVYNSSIPEHNNKKAFEFAEKYNLPKIAGTDSHGRHNEYHHGIELNKKANNIQDIIDAITTREIKLITKL